MFSKHKQTIPNDMTSSNHLNWINSLEVNDTIVTNMYVVCAVEVVMVVGD